jgi:hypothetical protein
MQPSQASNETRLPQAVIKRSAAIAARYAQPEPENVVPAADAAPAPPAAPIATPVEPPVDPRDTDPHYWKQRFQVTSGILAKERDTRKGDVEALNQRIAELQEEVRTTKAAVPRAKADLPAFFTPEQIAQYGEEQCEAMAQTAMKAAETTAAKLIDAAVQPLKQKAERESANREADSKQRFIDQLLELKPDYQTIDVDPRWLAWLAEEDESGVRRQKILDIHVLDGNAQACAKMFKTWEKTTVRPTPPITPNGSGAPPADPAAPTPVEGAAPTAAEVKAFYTKSALGKVKDDERVKFEARLRLKHPARP